jgi:MFS family permease
MTPGEHPQRDERRLILGVLALGCGGFALLSTIVAPALPVLQRDLHTSTSGAAWIFTSFLLATAVATPVAGRLGDMFGKKRVLVISLAALAAGSLLAAVVTSLPLLIAARTIQGLGGAIYEAGLAAGLVTWKLRGHSRRRRSRSCR